jgi:hypothetical protein
MSITGWEKFVKTIAVPAYLVTAFLIVLGSAQAQKDNPSKGICPWPGNLDGVESSA